MLAHAAEADQVEGIGAGVSPKKRQIVAPVIAVGAEAKPCTRTTAGLS